MSPTHARRTHGPPVSTRPAIPAESARTLATLVAPSTPAISLSITSEPQQCGSFSFRAAKTKPALRARSCSFATMPELPDRYDPSITEPAVYAQWLGAECFAADATRSSRIGGDRVPFTIVMPPPNVTGILHVGHGLTYTVQDVLIRWARMRRTEALWVPGTDHAGIATQNVVERLIAQEGKTRFDVGRSAFVSRTEAFVEEKGGVILKQLRAIGASADWNRTAYTLSPELSRAVRESFVRLYERGLIYKGHRVIHWCPRCLTSLSDEEAEFQDEPGALYHINYPLSGDAARYLTIATTRPETMLADVAVAVNPTDDRYRSLIGKTVRLPIVHIDIPVVADEYADPEFGTGVVKITPAHDANDFDVGQRHGLPAPIVIDEHGRMREAHGSDPHSARALGGRLRLLDGEHPRLEHLTAALVGPPHSGLVLRRLRSAAEYHSLPGRCGPLSPLRRAGATGRGRARHLVLVVALAAVDARLA
ncbi:MAG: hypothetical protein DMD26_11910 [Gemmatimonadetes bacterium]|nr:MAG: hypothetical protein DMD26_11910 [Gemmatimonadota bacterium]